MWEPNMRPLGGTLRQDTGLGASGRRTLRKNPKVGAYDGTIIIGQTFEDFHQYAESAMES